MTLCRVWGGEGQCGNPQSSWRRPAACHLDPLSKTAALLAFHVDNISITFAATADPVLLHRIRNRPVVIFLLAILLVGSGLKEWYVRELSSRCIRGTVLNSRVTIPEVSKVVYVSWGQQRPCG